MTIKKLNKEKKNPKIPKNLRIVYNEERKRYQWGDSGLSKQWKMLRRFLPEFKNKGEKPIVAKEIWDKIWPHISNAFWKVQIGMVTWFALVVEGSPWETDVLTYLEMANFKEARSRQTAIKVMGVFSEFFKLFKNEVERFSRVPWWVFSGSDCIFGYTETDTDEHVNWQKEVLDNITSWICPRKSEHFASMDLGLRYGDVYGALLEGLQGVPD